MRNLILPIAGKSSRFENLRPKFLLNHPNGNFMLIEAIKGLDMNFFDNIYIVCLKEHLDKYKFENGLMKQLEELKIKEKTRLTVIEESNNQPQTIYECIVKNDINGLISIKDCDNFFNTELIDDNFISYCDLNDINNTNIKNKSYIQTSNLGFVTNIIEKKIISQMFCNGLYTFKNSNDFKKYYQKNENILYHDILFDLNHNKRYLINDYSNSNPYPSGVAVNLKRNESNLKELM